MGTWQGANKLAAPIRATESDGSVQRYETSGFVTELAGASNSEKVKDALDSCPATLGDVPAIDDNLRLVERKAEVLQSDNTVAQVTLVYRSIAEAKIAFVFEFEAAVSSMQTPFTVLGQQITVQHTYPQTDQDFGGQTIVQGGTVDVLRPEAIARASGLLDVDQPDAVVTRWIGKINSDSWFGFGYGRWLCASVNYDPIDFRSSPKRYRFNFEFQLGYDNWNDIVRFTDPRSGEPPPGLVAGVGYKRPVTYLAMDFNDLFAV